MAIKYLDAKRIRGSSTGGASDALGSAVDGTNNGTTTQVATPIYGQTSVDFNGSSHYVSNLGTTASFASLTEEDFTIAFWLKATNQSSGNFGWIIGNGNVSGAQNGLIIGADWVSGGTFYINMRGGNDNKTAFNDLETSAIFSEDDKWHHYVFEFDNTNELLSIFKDGANTATYTQSYNEEITGNKSTAYQTMAIGRMGGTSNRFYDGGMCDVGIWKRLLTTGASSEVSTLFNSFDKDSAIASDNTGVAISTLTNEAGLLANWKCNDADWTNSASPTDEKVSLGTPVYAAGLGTSADITTVGTGTLGSETGSGACFTSGSELQTNCFNFGSTRVRTGNLQLIPRSDFTLAFWTKADTFATNGSNSPRYLHADGNSAIFELGNNADPKIINFHVSTASGTNAVEVAHGMSTGTWYHLAFVYDASNGDMIIYRDGSAIATDTSNPYSLPIKEHTSWWEFGGGSNEYMDGQMNDIAIWNKKLTSTQIGTLYGNGTSTVKRATSVDKENIVAYWDGSDTTLTVPNAAIPTTTYDLPENTLFEETNTREVYWLQSNAWVYGGDFSAVTAGGANRGDSTYYNQTYISAGGAGGSWTASTDHPASSYASMGGGGQTNFIMAGGKTTWESSEEGELDTTYKFTSGTWATLSGAYRGQWSTGGGNQTDAIRFGGRNSGYTNNAATWGGSSWTNITGMNFHQGGSAGDGTSSNGVCFGGHGSSNGGNPQYPSDRSDYWNGSSWTSATGKLLKRRANATYAGNNTSGIHCGGASFVSSGNTFTYNEADCETWNGSSMTEVADLPAGTDGTISAGNDTKAMVWCGATGTSSSDQTDKTYIWNGSAWTTKTAHPVARYRPHGGAEGL